MHEIGLAPWHPHIFVVKLSSGNIPLPLPPSPFQTERRLKELETQAADAGREGDDAIVQYKSLVTKLAELDVALRAVCMQPQYCLQFLRAGRVVAIMDGVVRESV